jgi:hypothetical protein
MECHGVDEEETTAAMVLMRLRGPASRAASRAAGSFGKKTRPDFELTFSGQLTGSPRKVGVYFRWKRARGRR